MKHKKYSKKSSMFDLKLKSRGRQKCSERITLQKIFTSELLSKVKDTRISVEKKGTGI